MTIRFQDGRYICPDCGSELEQQWGKQYRDADEPVSKTQAAYVMFCRTCNSTKGEWTSPDERDSETERKQVVILCGK